MIKKGMKQLAMTAIAIAITAYIVLQLFLSVGTSVDVENAGSGTAVMKNRYDVYIFREETVLRSSSGGTSCYLVDDGEKVYKNEAVAYSYKNTSDASKQDEINELTDKLEILEKSSKAISYSSNDLTRIDESIKSLVLELIKNAGGNEMEKNKRPLDSLTVELNRRRAIINSTDIFENLISTYKAQKASLEAALTGEKTVISAGDSGYFYSEIDGYESIFSETALENITVEGFEALKTSSPENTADSTIVGKVATSAKWFMLYNTTKRNASDMTVGYNYKFAFPYSAGTEISMKLERAVTQTNSDEAIMIFSSGKLVRDFDFTRKQTAEYIYATHEGIKIPVNAVRRVNGVTGVYVLDGNVVIFKTAEILCQQNGYYIVEYPKQYIKSTDEYIDAKKSYISPTALSLYDAVIVGGRDITAGKIIR